MILHVRWQIAALLVIGLVGTTFPVHAQPVRVDLDPFRINLQPEDRPQQVIGAPPGANPKAAFGLFFNGAWERIPRASRVEGEGQIYEAVTDQGTPVRITVDTRVPVSTVTIEAPPDIARIGYAFVPADGEKFYAYSRPSTRLDRRGTLLDSRRDSVAVPFALSSLGYGVYLPDAGNFQFNFGQTAELFTFWTEGSTGTFQFITTENIERIVELYSDAAGRMGLPPTTQYGAMKRVGWDDEKRSASQIAALLNAYDAAPSTYVVPTAPPRSERAVISPGDSTAVSEALSRSVSADSSASVPPDLTAVPPSTEPRDATPPADAFLDAGYNVVVPQHPYAVEGTPRFESAASANLLVIDSTGVPAYFNTEPGSLVDRDRRASGDSARVALIDFTHKGAASWWSSQLDSLANSGVSGVALQYAPLPDTCFYAVKEGGRVRWETWRRQYVKGTRAAFANAGIRHPIILGSALDGGPSRHVSLVESTGWTADFDSTTGLPAAVVAAQSAGLAGTPLWTAYPDRPVRDGTRSADRRSSEASETGSATDAADLPPSLRRKAAVRWLQFAALTPSMHVGSVDAYDAWLGNPDVAAILRRYTRLHEQLSTYFYTLYQASQNNGTPIMRPLFLDSRQAARATDRDDQYLLGEDLLVAPVTDSTQQRDVYLPPGPWMHYWSLEVYDGNRTLTALAPLEEIPLFVRARRDALSNVYRPLYERQLRGLTRRIENGALSTSDVPSPPSRPWVNPEPPMMEEPLMQFERMALEGLDIQTVDQDTTVRYATRIEDDTAPADSMVFASNGSGGSVDVGPSGGTETQGVDPRADAASGTDAIATLTERLLDVLDQAPSATASSTELRAFADALDDIRTDVADRRMDGTISPVAASTVIERLDDLDRCLRSMITLINV